MPRKSTLGLVRKGRSKVRGHGYIVTWDVDSSDRSAAFRLWSFLFGRAVQVDGHVYRYPGYVWKDGVRYLGQSVLFVLPHRLAQLTSFLASHGVDHEVDAMIFP